MPPEADGDDRDAVSARIAPMPAWARNVWARPARTRAIATTASIATVDSCDLVEHRCVAAPNDAACASYCFPDAQVPAENGCDFGDPRTCAASRVPAALALSRKRSARDRGRRRRRRHSPRARRRRCNEEDARFDPGSEACFHGADDDCD